MRNASGNQSRKAVPLIGGEVVKGVKREERGEVHSVYGDRLSKGLRGWTCSGIWRWRGMFKVKRGPAMVAQWLSIEL